jgi:hypothetical protein
MKNGMQRRWLYRGTYVIFFAGILAGCSSAPKLGAGKGIAPAELFKAACEPGSTVESAEGSVWFKAKSTEVSGQFGANVKSTFPDQLRLEVTNILGGTEAVIRVDHEHYEITGSKAEKKGEGRGSWGGVPLHWATDLFLGKMPCPSPSSDLKMEVDSEGLLTIQVPASTGIEAQKFIFSFRQHLNKPWPNSLHWERNSVSAIAVDFKFDDPEDETLSPKKWEAHSAQGVVKIRWRDRDIKKKSMN